MNKGEWREKTVRQNGKTIKNKETGANEMRSELQGRHQWWGQRRGARRRVENRKGSIRR